MDASLNEFGASSDEKFGSASDEESGDSSESSSEDDNEEGEESEDSEVEKECDGDENIDNTAVITSDEDPERECCPICLNRFVGQDLGTPESCEHTFCFECIQEWSKNINTCPIDRTEFNYIYLRTVPGGKVLKKVKVKVSPKEAEETLQESVTLCEVCQSGDREDRLLLCDGCDLAYHCECLDEPLFYIPIEEWFCPPCFNVFSNKAIAGPSHSRVRRVIPRTRASEVVRSRVQNLRAGPSSTPRSISNHSRVSKASTSGPKKRKRRRYKRAIKKVVHLARTKKSQSDTGKGKLAARATTVLVTYRRGRRKKRRSTKRRSKKSLASSKAIPSAQQRIAKRLGISKSHESSSMSQVKKTSGIRLGSGSRGDKMSSHSLFGNKNQLMDFNENFHEDINAPSTSRSVPIRRTSIDNASSNSSVNILDSIFAGYKLLHAKSDNIVIKTDGSLVLKESKANVKIPNSTIKPEVSHSSHTPMSLALAKEGVKSLTPLSGKKSHSLPKQEINKTSKINIHLSNQSKLCSEKPSSKIKISNKLSITKNSSGNSSSKESTNDKRKKFSEERNGKGTLSTWKIPKKSEVNSKEKYTSVEGGNLSLTDGFECDIPSDWESELSNQRKKGGRTAKILNAVKKENVGTKYVLESKGSRIGSSLKSNNLLKESGYSTENLIYSSKKDLSTKSLPAIHIKKEIESDDETDSNALSGNVKTVYIKQEILSDEETNIDYCVPGDAKNKEQKIDGNRLATNIKKEFNDSDFETSVSQNGSFTNDQSFSANISDLTHNKDTSENEDSDLDASQSIIESVPNDSSYSSQHRKGKTQIPSIKIKEEMPSDSEEFSQSLMSNLESPSQYGKSNSGLLSNPNILISSKLHINGLPEDELPCTQVASYPVANDKMSSNNTSNCNASHLSHNTGELPDTELLTQHVSSLHDKRADHNVFRNEKNASAAAFADLPSPERNDESDSDTSNNDSHNSDDELPQTQFNPMPNKFLSNSKDVSSNPIQNGKFSKNITDYETLHSDEELPPMEYSSTSEITDEYMSHNLDQLNSSRNKEGRDLPETNNLSSCVSQNFNPTSKMNSHLSDIAKEACKSSGLPATQIFNSPSKEISNFCKPTQVSIESKVLPATQVFNVVPRNVDISDSQVLATDCESLAATEMLDASDIIADAHRQISILANECNLPETQMFDVASDIADAHRQISMLASESEFPETQLFDVPPEISDIHDTQASVLAGESSLPATQMFTATVEPCIISSKMNTNSSSPCLPDQTNDKDININMSDIMSNIKQIVSNLSKHPNDLHFKNNQDKNDIAPNDSGNVSESNTNSDNPEIDASTDAENAANIEDSNNVSHECPENSDSSDSESELLSPEKLKELLSKSNKLDSPKNLGVHKHLPQVITVKPVKELVKPKLSYRRTFSFDEVAKLEKPMLEKSHNFDEAKVGETLENLDNNSSDIDQDNIIAAQNVENDKNGAKIQQPENNMTEYSSKIASLKNVGLNNKSIRNAIDKLFSMDFVNSSVEATYLDNAIPATQVAALPPNGFSTLPNTQNATPGIILDGKQTFLSSKEKMEKIGICPERMNVPDALENIKNEIKHLTENYCFPDTQICNFSNKHNFITPFQKIKEEISLKDIEENKLHLKLKNEIISLSDSNEINLPSTQICDFSKEIKSFEPCIKIKKEVSDSDESRLSSSQFCDFKQENKKIKKEIFLSDSDESSLPSTQIFNFKKINPSKSSSKTRMMISDYENCNGAEASESSVNLHDLPVTHVFKVPVEYSNKTYELSTAKSKSKDPKDDLSYPLDVNVRNKNPSAAKKHHEILDCSSDISKRKKIFNNNYSYSDKEYSNQDRSAKNLQPKELGHVKEKVSSKDCSRGSKRPCEQEKSDKESKKTKKDSKMMKQKPKQSSRKDNTKSTSFSNDRKAFSVEKSSKSLKNNISHESIKLTEIVGKTQTVTIKQEKVDLYLENMTSVIQNKDSPASHKNVNVHSKSVDEFEDNSLPSTQAVNFDIFEDNSFPATQSVNFDHIAATNFTPIDITTNSGRKQIEVKSSSQLKKSDMLSDDEISIIEVKTPANLRVNEEVISIDDDDDAIIVPQVNTSKKIKKVSVNVEKDVDECRQSIEKDDILKTKKNISKSKSSGIKIVPNDVEKDKNLTDSSFLKGKHKPKIYESEVKSKTKNKNHRSRLEDVKKCKFSNDTSILTKDKQIEHKNDLLKSKTKNKQHSSRPDDVKICKISKDTSILTKEKQKDNDSLKLKSKIKVNDDSKVVKKSNCSKEPTILKGGNEHEKKENNKLKSKGIDLKNESKLLNKKTVSDSTNDIQVHEVSNSSNLQKEKLVRSSSEKENESSFKKKHTNDDIIITLKHSSRKRPHRSDEFSKNRKRSRCESFSSDISSELHNSFEDETNPSVKQKPMLEFCDDSTSNSTVKSPLPFVIREARKICRKQDLKEEIATEVKLVLKPFFSTGLITKEDYKDIMRRAVPKIFVNCHNCIHPEKIRKLVLSYVSLLNKS